MTSTAGPVRAELAPPVPDAAEAVAAVVLAVPGVAGLHGGTFGEVATYLPGRAVTGVRIRGGVTEVHLVLFWAAPVLATADAVRAAVQPLVGGRVDVAVEDLFDPAAGAVPPRTVSRG